MRQDLTDWLNGESGTKGTGLLLAPLGASSDRPGTEKPNLLIATGTTALKKEEKEETPQRVKAGPVPAAGLEPDPQPVPESEHKPEVQPDPQPAPEPERKPEVQTEPQPGPQPEPEPQMEQKTASEPGPEPEPEITPPSQPQTEPEPDLQPEPDPQPELKSKPEPEPPEQVPLKPAMEQKPRPMPSLWTHAVSMPDDWSLVGLLDEEDEEVEESEGTRNKAFTQKLHKGLQERKNQTKERRSREQAPIQRYWPRAFAFCIVLILVLTGAWAVLRYLQKNIHPRGDDGLSHPVQTDVGTKNPPAALPGALSASVPAVLLSPDEKPAKPAEESVPVKPAPKKTELPAEKPAAVEKPAKPQDNPVPVSHPVSSEDKPMPPVKPAPKKPVPPAEKPASVEKPAKPAEKPVSVEKPAKPVEKPVSVEKPAKPVEKPAPVKKQTEPVLPVSYEGQVRQGTAALNNKRYDEALETFSQALERRKDDPRAWLGIVAAFEGKGAVGEAFRVLVDARNALPRNPTIEVKLRDLQQRNK